MALPTMTKAAHPTWLDDLFFGTSSHVVVPGLLVRLLLEIKLDETSEGCELRSECPIDDGFYRYDGDRRIVRPASKPSFLSRIFDRIRRLQVGEPIGLQANIEPIANLVFERFNAIRHSDLPTHIKRCVQLVPGEGDAFDRAYAEQGMEYQAKLDDLILKNTGKTIAEFEFEEVYDFQSMPGRKELEREFEQKDKQLLAQWRVYLRARLKEEATLSAFRA